MRVALLVSLLALTACATQPAGFTPRIGATYEAENERCKTEAFEPNGMVVLHQNDRGEAMVTCGLDTAAWVDERSGRIMRHATQDEAQAVLIDLICQAGYPDPDTHYDVCRIHVAVEIARHRDRQARESRNRWTRAFAVGLAGAAAGASYTPHQPRTTKTCREYDYGGFSRLICN